MQLRCLRDELVGALQLALPFTSQRGSLPILSGVLMETNESEVLLRTTDLNSFFKTSLSCDLEGSGKCVVNARLLLDILKDMEEESLQLRYEENRLSLEGVSSFFHLQVMPWEDFPEEPEKGSLLAQKIPFQTFSSSLDKVSRAASKDDKRPILTGIYLQLGEGVITMVCTDSYRLSLIKVKDNLKTIGSGEYVVPSQVSNGIAKLAQKCDHIDLYGEEGGSYLTLSSEGFEIKVRLIEGKFPKYEQFIPKDLDKEVKVDKKRILSSLKRVTHVGSTVKMELKDGGIRISTVSKDVGEAFEEIPAEYRGEEMTIAFNGRFLEDGLASVDGDEVLMGFSEPLKPAVIKGVEGEDFIYLVMPVRL